MEKVEVMMRDHCGTGTTSNPRRSLDPSSPDHLGQDKRVITITRLSNGSPLSPQLDE